MKLKEIKSFSWKKSYDKSRQCIKKQRHHFADKGLYSLKAMVFPVVMYRCDELDQNEGWALKNWRLQFVLLEKILDSPLDCKEIESSQC